MKTHEQLKKSVLEIVRICEKQIVSCKACPFWDDDLECRLRCPMCWWISDWKEKQTNDKL